MIDTAGEVITASINDALSKYTKITHSRGKKETRPRWWTDKCAAAKKLVYTKTKQYRKNRTNETWAEIGLAQKEYYYIRRKAKRAYFKASMENIEDEKTFMRIMKSKKGSSPQTGRLKNKDGKITETAEETLKVMLDKFCPGAEIIPDINKFTPRPAIKTKDVVIPSHMEDPPPPSTLE